MDTNRGEGRPGAGAKGGHFSPLPHLRDALEREEAAGHPLAATRRHPASAASGRGVPPATYRCTDAGFDVLVSLAGIVRVLADADVAAVVAIRDHALVVEPGHPGRRGLRPGTSLGLHPSTSRTDRWKLIASLLSGELGWSYTPPPSGFAQAALVGVPDHRSTGRLLLVANRTRPLADWQLAVTAAFSSNTSRLLATTAGQSRPAGSGPPRRPHRCL